MTTLALNTETLIIVGRDPADRLEDLLGKGTSLDGTSVILVQDAVTATYIPTRSVHVLDEDLQRRHITSPFPRVTYDGLLQMIFASKKVMVL